MSCASKLTPTLIAFRYLHDRCKLHPKTMVPTWLFGATCIVRARTRELLRKTMLLAWFSDATGRHRASCEMQLARPMHLVRVKLQSACRMHLVRSKMHRGCLNRQPASVTLESTSGSKACSRSKACFESMRKGELWGRNRLCNFIAQLLPKTN